MRRLVPLLLLAGCAGLAPPPHEPLDRAPTAAEEATRPRTRRGVHQERWILRRGGTEFAFTVLIEVDEELRFVALDDFGGVLADGDGRTSRALPARLVARLRRACEVRYAPPEAHLARVGDGTGWAADGAVWTGDAVYADGMRIRTLAPGRCEIDGALRATVTGTEGDAP